MAWVLVMIFFSMTPKAQATKSKVSGTHETTELLHSKKNHQQGEKTIYRWEKIFANYISDEARQWYQPPLIRG